MKPDDHPTRSDADELLARFREAEAAIPEIEETSGGYPVYPKAVNGFTSYVSRSAWSRTDYTAFSIPELRERIEEANLGEVRALLTAVIRCERFSPGALQGILEDGTVRRIVDRACELVR